MNTHMNTALSLLSKLGLLVLSYFAPVREIVYAVLALILIDWCTGIWKAMLNKNRITSYKLKKTINKMGAYMVVIIASHIVSESFNLQWLHLTNVLTGYLAITELISILENLSCITGKDILKDIVIALKVNVLKKYFGKKEE